MSEKSFRIRNQFNSILNNYFREFKGRIILLCIIFIISFITGILTCIEYSDVVTCENLIDKYLYSFLKNDMNFFSYFLMVALFYLLLGLLCFIFASSKIMCFINCCIFSLISYIFGFDLCIIIITLGLSGIIFGILFRGVWIFVLFIYILYLAVVTKIAFSKDRCFDKKSLFKLFLILSFISLLILFVTIILFSTIHIFIILD